MKKNNQWLVLEEISRRQLLFLILFWITPTAILFVPSITATHGMEDAWVSALLAMILGAFVSIPIIWLTLHYSEESIAQFSRRIMGKWMGNLLTLSFIWVVVHADAIVAREFAEFMTSAIRPDAENDFFIIPLMIVSAIAVRSGLENIARMAEFLFPVLFILTIFLLLLGVFQGDLYNILPLFNQPFRHIFAGSASPTVWLGETFLLFILMRHVHMKKYGKKKIFYSVLGTVVFIGLLFSLTVFVALFMFGAEDTARYKFPFFTMAASIDIGEMLQRLDIIVVAIWIAGVFMKFTIFFHCAVDGLSELFQIRTYRVLVIPVGLILYSLSHLLYNNINELTVFLGQALPPYFWIWQIGFPFIFIITAKLRGVW